MTYPRPTRSFYDLTLLTHLQDDLDSRFWSHWVRFFGEHFRYVRYDERGCGMSDWQAGDLAQQHWVGDLENVVDAAGLAAPFALLGISQGAAPSIPYAVRPPDRVSPPLLYGGSAVGGPTPHAPPRRAPVPPC